MEETEMDDRSTTPPQPEQSLLGLILEIAAAANVKLEQDSLVVYYEHLSILTPADAQRAAHRTIREWDKPHMMPPIGFILARSETNPQLAAEQAWDWIQLYARRHWHPDIGHFKGAPEIAAPIEYAVRQVGGLNRIAYPKERDMDFIRRGFLDAHQRFVAEGGEQVRLSRADAKRLMDRLRLGQAGDESI
jgi:hypothetical protein